MSWDEPVAAAAACAAAGPAGMAAALRGLRAAAPPARDAADGAALLPLLRLLHAVGRRDLPLGRLFEGDTDARQIVHRYGRPDQAPPPGAILGVWNADLPDRPIRWADERLTGTKGFASGAGVLTHALVTADGDWDGGGRQLLLVDLAAAPPAIDRGWWRTTGMQRSDSHIVRWEAAPVPAAAAVGAPGDYAREPWLSGGALRFAAVQAGGVAGLFDAVRDHLVAAGRAADPHQAGRLAALYAAGEAAAAAVRRAADGWAAPAAERLALVAAARVAVAAAGDAAITLAEQAVGLAGLFTAHPLAARLADLAVYLRQPGPDAQRMRVGAAAAAGLLSPAL